MKGKIYLVATPIGNLEDITFRAISVLKDVDIIAAEDTRHTLKLLNYYEISKPLISYHRHNEDVKSDVLIEKVLNGQNVAIVTDAGTPGISDPGEEIVKEAIKNNIEIIPIPGACAFVNAIIASGLNTKQFSFYGFLPMNKKLRKKTFENILKENKTIIIYEAPHKLHKTLQDILDNIGDIKCVIAKELTKIHETFFRGKISDLINNFESPKGEYIILIDLNNTVKEKNNFENMNIEEQYKFYKNQGIEKKEIIKLIAKNKKVPKNDIYKLFLNRE